jgi:hypothetical protein
VEKTEGGDWRDILIKPITFTIVLSGMFCTQKLDNFERKGEKII